jgi:hypothetical protein
MGTITVLTVLILALAPLIGFMIGRFTKEEFALGKRYFIIAQRCLFTLVIATFLFAFKWQIWYVVIGLTVLFAYLAFAAFRNLWFVQFLLALAFVLSSTTPLAFLCNTLMFLHGLPTGSLLTGKKQGIRDAFAAGALFFLAGLAFSYVLQ